MKGTADAVSTVAKFVPKTGKWGKMFGAVAKGADKFGKAADVVDKGSGFAKGFFSPLDLDESVRHFYSEPENIFDHLNSYDGTYLANVKPNKKKKVTRQELENVMTLNMAMQIMDNDYFETII